MKVAYSSPKGRYISAKISWAALVVLLTVAGILAWQYIQRHYDDTGAQVTSFEQCAAAGYVVQESYPRRCLTPDGTSFVEEQAGPTQFMSNKGIIIELNDFRSGQIVSSPLRLTGRVPGSWSFEASFPIALKDARGVTIAEGPATLLGDWMTDDLVSFNAELSFNKPVEGNAGILRLQRDNPSGLSENDDYIDIPVGFE